MEKRKCSMCGEYKTIENFRFMKHLNRHNCYCHDCEKWYQHQYGKIRYERMKNEIKTDQS